MQAMADAAGLITAVDTTQMHGDGRKADTRGRRMVQGHGIRESKHPVPMRSLTGAAQPHRDAISRLWYSRCHKAYMKRG